MPEARQSTTLRHPKFDVGLRPFIVIWEVTRACDLACVHCRAESIPLRHRAELTTAEGRTLIDQVAAMGSPPPLLVMTGGDPMKRPDLVELVAHAASRHLPAALSPSATPLLTPSSIAELKSAGLKVISLSLDGAEPRTHDHFRGVNGVFARTMAVWDAAREHGIKVQINTSIARNNLFELPAIAHMLLKSGVMTWSIFLLVPVGRGGGLEPLSAVECEDLLHFLYEIAGALPIKTTEAHHFKRIFVERAILERRGIRPQEGLELRAIYYALRKGLGPWPESSRSRRPPMEVNSGRGFVFISHTGGVYPSGFMPLAAGNVRSQPLGEIYRSSSLMRDLRDPSKLTGRCGQCEYASVCGGSRSRAFGILRSPFAEDPLCAYRPHSFYFREDVAELVAQETRSDARSASA